MSVTDINKFREKNEDVFKEFDYFMGHGIEYIVISTELENYAGLLYYEKYKGVPIIVNPYFPSGRMDLISNKTMGLFSTLRFDVPCVCGVYSDEDHK